jgi:hypothetical protein
VRYRTEGKGTLRYTGRSDKEKNTSVKNVGGTVLRDTGRNWLAYWETLSAQNAFMCFVDGCINTPSVGGLVQKEGASDGKWYVIPLCGECSKLKTAELDGGERGPPRQRSRPLETWTRLESQLRGKSRDSHSGEQRLERAFVHGFPRRGRESVSSWREARGTGLLQLKGVPQ